MAATTPCPLPATIGKEQFDPAKRWQEVGKDVLIEAIRTYLQGDRNLQLLYDYADNLRVRDIIHPYLEAMA